MTIRYSISAAFYAVLMKTLVVCVVLSSCFVSRAEMRVEKLASDIWRVRISRSGDVREGHLNRYGVLEKLAPLAAGDDLTELPVRVVTSLTANGWTLDLPVTRNARIYGLGDVDRTGLNRRGKVYDLRVENIKTYIPIPMLMTSDGWGILVNTTFVSRFDVGASDPDAMTVTAEKGGLDFYVFTGKDAAELIDAYTRVTGRPSMLPIWGYGFTFVAHQWIDQFALVDETNAFRDRQIPCDVMGLEPGWMEKFYDPTTHKRWDPTRFHFPFWRPAGSLNFPAAMERVGMKLSLWLCCKYDLFRYEEECVAGKDTLRQRKALLNGHTENDTWVDEHIEGGDAAKVTAKPDESRMVTAFAGDPHPYQFEEGTRPWFEHLQQFVDQGAQAFKLDGAWQVSEENGVPGRTWSNGMSDGEAHNLYPIVYDKQMATGYERYTGKRAMVYSAGGYAGVQQFVATWAGDTGGGEKPCASLLNLGMSGHSNQSCDMDIFRPQSLHFGMLQTWSQQNNWAYWKQPWYQRKAALDAFRAYLKLRYRLIPYLYTAAAEANRTGWPVMRALPFVYPDVPAYDACKTTYMLGDSLLVCAFTETAEIPAGTWYDWRTDRIVAGPAKEKLAITPDWGGGLYVKAGAIVPTWPEVECLDRGWNDELVYEVYLGADGAGELYEDDGLTLAYRTGGASVARTPLTLSDGPAATFAIGRRAGGSFGGARTVTVRFHGVNAEPRAVTAKGVPAAGEWDAANRTYTFKPVKVGADGADFVLTK